MERHNAFQEVISELQQTIEHYNSKGYAYRWISDYQISECQDRAALMAEINSAVSHALSNVLSGVCNKIIDRMNGEGGKE